MKNKTQKTNKKKKNDFIKCLNNDSLLEKK